VAAHPKHFYEFGPFRIDVSERTLLRDGQVVPIRALSRSPFAPRYNLGTCSLIASLIDCSKVILRRGIN
jgi:hypothetical protein